MKKKVLLLLCLFACTFSFAQLNTFCDFERLFTVKPGMDKLAVIDTLQKNSKITLLKMESDKLKPYSGTGGDSIIHEIAIYRIDSSACLKGRNNTIKFEFADNKLYKAYLVTDYLPNELPELMANFNFLRGNIKRSWKYEKEVRLEGITVEGIGYEYSNTSKKTLKTSMCSLQYIKNKSDNPARVYYQLEILWANLNKTRMESSIF